MNTLRTFLLLAVMVGTLALGVGFQASTAQAGGPDPVVIFETTMGRIIVILYPKQTPITVENFLKYVDAGFYDGTIFHRVVNQKKNPEATNENDTSLNAIQGGGYSYPMRGKRTMPPILNESSKGLMNKKGTISMARANDTNSATSQFFFNVENNPITDDLRIEDKWDKEKFTTQPGYCAFGKVLRGMDVVEKIHKVKTTSMGGMKDVPVTPVYITKAYRAK